MIATLMQNKLFTTAEAINLAIKDTMKKNKNTILFGEGIDDPSSMFGTTNGIKKLFPKNRVFEMPLSENLFIGAAIGASYFGDRVIVNLQRVEFLLLAMEQLINNAAKSSYISYGRLNVPIVIRAVVGRGWGQGPEHSQSLESLFSMVPGLKVAMICFPDDAYHITKEAILDNNPCIIIESRWCHYNLGKINFKKNQSLKSFNKLSNGRDLTIVSSSYTTSECSVIAKFLTKYNIHIDLLDLKLLSPLDLTMIKSSLRKTKKLIVIETGHKFLGMGSEIISSLVENNFTFEKPPIRLGLPFSPTPSSRAFIDEVYITPSKILKNILNLLNIEKKIRLKILDDFKINFENKMKDIPNNNFKGPF